jgi:hypothetical protein
VNDEKLSMLEIHSEALDHVDEAFHLFLLYYQKDANYVYGFVEGKDDPIFYYYLIQRELPSNWEVKLIPSGNKHKVLRTHQSFDWSKFDPERVCFFLDRDLSDFVGPSNVLDKNIYVTDGYSIENSIVNEHLLMSVLADVYQVIPETPKQQETLVSLYQQNENIFTESLLPLMAQIVIWRRTAIKANLSNLNLGECFKFSSLGLKGLDASDLLALAAKNLGCNQSSQEDIDKVLKELKRHPQPNLLLRGKYLHWFFVQQCEMIWESIESIFTGQSKQNKRISYGLKNAVVITGPRARIPNSLRAFIAGNFLSFIANI